MAGFRPLLSATIEDVSLLRFPLIASPKLDGIRLVLHPTLGPVTRSLKPVRNKYVRMILADPALWGLDGEVVVGEPTAPDVFNKTTSGVMSEAGTPDFTFLAFDYIGRDTGLMKLPFEFRYSELQKVIQEYNAAVPESRIYSVYHTTISDPLELDWHEHRWIDEGYEGMMLRDPKGPYKCNRSTFKEHILMKLKRFADDEAVVTGFEELLRNQNEPVKNELGFTERSDHQANKVPANMLGKLVVYHPKWGEFRIGSGFDVALREEIWNNKEKYKGRLVTFKYQSHGVIDKPRIPIFKGFREVE